MNVTTQKFQSFRRGDESRPHPHGFASTPMNGKTLARIKPKNHPPADEISSGRVIDVMGVALAPILRGVL